MLERTPRRDLIAGLVAFLFTLLATLLAVAGGGPYDPSVAVLTATLIAIIWYTFFTFQAVHRVQPAWVEYNLIVSPIHGIAVFIRNPCEHALSISVTQRIWADGRFLREIPVHASSIGEYFELTPKDELEVPVDTGQEYEPDGGGGQIAQRKGILLGISVTLAPSFDRLGSSTAKYWVIDREPVRIVSAARLRKLRGKTELQGL